MTNFICIHNYEIVLIFPFL